MSCFSFVGSWVNVMLGVRGVLDWSSAFSSLSAYSLTAFLRSDQQPTCSVFSCFRQQVIHTTHRRFASGV